MGDRGRRVEKWSRKKWSGVENKETKRKEKQRRVEKDGKGCRRKVCVCVRTRRGHAGVSSAVVLLLAS